MAATGVDYGQRVTLGRNRTEEGVFAIPTRSSLDNHSAALNNLEILRRSAIPFSWDE